MHMPVNFKLRAIAIEREMRTHERERDACAQERALPPWCAFNIALKHGYVDIHVNMIDMHVNIPTHPILD